MRNHEEEVRTRVDEGAPGPLVREHQHEPERDLIGDDVSAGPSRKPEDLTYGGVAPVREEAQVHPGAAQRRDQRQPHRGDARGGPEPDEEQQPVTVEHVPDRERPAVDLGNQDEDRDDDEVVEHGRERGGRESPSGLEHRGGERGQPVEHHLHHEHAEQRGREFLLGRSTGSVHAECVDLHDQWGGDDPDHGDAEQRDIVTVKIALLASSLSSWR